MKGIGPIIKFMESELTLGKMEKYTQVNGKKEICMDKEYLAGLMEEDMKVNICLIRNMGLEYILGKTEGSMLDSGKMVSSTDKEFIKI
jgi:hypothetical protein